VGVEPDLGKYRGPPADICVCTRIQVYFLAIAPPLTPIPSPLPFSPPPHPCAPCQKHIWPSAPKLVN
jgi:hypothetical protein